MRFRSGAPPEVRISAYRDGEVWRFSVRDNGIRIASEYKVYTFQLFARLRPWTKIPGAGIGLAICKRIVEHHGGKIWLEAELGSRSTFYFTVPTAAGHGAQPKEPATKTIAAGSDDAIPGASEATKHSG